MAEFRGALMNKLTGYFTHVIPRGDYREHRLSTSCWCRPCQLASRPLDVIHNAMDGREPYRPGTRSRSWVRR